MAKEGGKPVSRGRRPGQGDVTQPGALRPLLALPLSHLTDDRFQAWLRNEVARRPTQADLAYRLLSGFVNWCGERPEYRDQLPGGLNFARIARRELPKRTAKADCLQREQLQPWFEQVRQLANPVHRVYLQCLLLTGARREELAALRWKDVDFRWNSLRIADKIEANGRPIPLTPYVAQLLRELKRSNVRPLKLPPGEKWEPSPWVFASSRAKSGRMQEPRIAHQRALTAAGLPPLTLHGLRRSFGTLAEWVECPVGIAAQIMGHKPSATAEKHYRQRPIDLLRLGTAHRAMDTERSRHRTQRRADRLPPRRSNWHMADLQRHMGAAMPKQEFKSLEEFNEHRLQESVREYHAGRMRLAAELLLPKAQAGERWAALRICTLYGEALGENAAIEGDVARWVGGLLRKLGDGEAIEEAEVPKAQAQAKRPRERHPKRPEGSSPWHSTMVSSSKSKAEKSLVARRMVAEHYDLGEESVRAAWRRHKVEVLRLIGLEIQYCGRQSVLNRVSKY